jgi:hypothetical protein
LQNTGQGAALEALRLIFLKVAIMDEYEQLSNANKELNRRLIAVSQALEQQQLLTSKLINMIETQINSMNAIINMKAGRQNDD